MAIVNVRPFDMSNELFLLCVLLLFENSMPKFNVQFNQQYIDRIPHRHYCSELSKTKKNFKALL